MKAMKPADRTAWAERILQDAGVLSGDDADDRARLGRLLGLLGNRFSHFDRTVPHLSAYFGDDYPVGDDFVFDRASRTRLARLADAYEALETFDATTSEQALRALAEAEGEKAGAYIHPTRFAATGSTSGPSLFDALELLGQRRVVARLRAPRTV